MEPQLSKIDSFSRSIIATFGKLRPARTEQPILSHGHIITCFEFDRQDEKVVRYGTSAGLLGKGRLKNERPAHSHSVDHWESEHLLGASISSVHMDQGFMM